MTLPKKWTIALLLALSVLLQFDVEPGAGAQLDQQPGDRGLCRRLLLGRRCRLQAREGGYPKLSRDMRGEVRDTANYETVSTGTTGHAESVQVTYICRGSLTTICLRSSFTSLTI